LTVTEGIPELYTTKLRKLQNYKTLVSVYSAVKSAMLLNSSRLNSPIGNVAREYIARF